MAKSAKLTKKMLKNFDRGELRMIAQVGMKLSRLQAFTFDHDKLVDWVYQHPAQFREVDIDVLDADLFRDSVKDYAKALQRMVSGEGPAPAWPYNRDEDQPEEGAALQGSLPQVEEVKETEEEEEVKEVPRGYSGDDTTALPDHLLTPSGKPDLRKSETRKILGKPPLRRSRARKSSILSPKADVKAPEKELRETTVEISEQLQETISKLEQKLDKTEQRLDEVSNALLFMLNMGKEFLNNCTVLDGGEPYESLSSIPKPTEYLDDDDTNL